MRRRCRGANYPGLVRKTMRDMFPDVKGRKDKRALYRIVSTGASFILRERVLADPGLVGRTERVRVPADDDIDMLVKGPHRSQRAGVGAARQGQPARVGRVARSGRPHREALQHHVLHRRRLARAGARGDPRCRGRLVLHPAGHAGAVVSDRRRSRRLSRGVRAGPTGLTDFIEVNINNLAAVPSIIFGLLGLAVFINFFGLPRSAPLVGGLVLTLMTLPTHHHREPRHPEVRPAVDPRGGARDGRVEDADDHAPRPCRSRCRGCSPGRSSAWPQALGETAPLLMIGMVAFIVDVPGGPLDPSNGAAGPDLPVGGQPGTRVRRAHVGRHHGPARVPHRDERRRGHRAPAVRAPLVAASRKHIVAETRDIARTGGARSRT